MASSTAMTTTFVLLFSWLSLLVVPAASLPSTTRRNIDPPPAAWNICAGGRSATTILSSVMGDNDISETFGSCKSVRTAQIEEGNGTSPNVQGLGGGQADACPTIEDQCVKRFTIPAAWTSAGWVPKCGATCTTTCVTGTGGPDPNHCQAIHDSLVAKTEKVFTLEPDNFVLYTHQTCASSIQNQIAPSLSSTGCSQKMIYDYPDWASVGNYVARNCQATQNARGGKCVGDLGIYQRQIGDFFVQIARNA